MAVFSRMGAFLKNAWNKEPVVTVSVGIGILAAIVPLASPYMKYASMYNKAVPYSYPEIFYGLPLVITSDGHSTQARHQPGMKKYE